MLEHLKIRAKELARSPGGPGSTNVRADTGPDPDPRFSHPPTLTDPAADAPCGAFVAEEYCLPDAPVGYELVSEIGSGGMGVVYKAKETATGRFLAVKYLTALLAPNARERFRREAEALAALEHPNVVRVHAVNLLGTNPHFTMEYAAGGTLAQRLRTRGPLAPADAAGLIESVARSLAEAHKLGIVHRDVKPSNILLAGDGTPKLADFGLARRTEAGLTITGTLAVVGTAHYMSPEQAEGAGEVGPGADIYSLGATFFEALTGRPPFTGEVSYALYERIKHDFPPTARGVNPAVPAELSAVVEKCLQKSPAARYASADDLAADLARWRGGERVSAQPASRLKRLRRAAARNSRWVVLTSTSVLFAVGTALAILPRADAVRPPETAPLSPADAVRARLKKGETVTLVNADGPTVPPEIVLGGGEIVTPQGEPGYWVRAKDCAMVRFLDATGIPAYRITAELKQYKKLPSQKKDEIHIYGVLFRVGLFTDHSVQADGDRLFHSAVTTIYSEFDTTDKPEQRLVSYAAFGCSQLPFMDVAESSSRMYSHKLARGGEFRPWRTIEIEIRPDQTVVRADGSTFTETPELAAKRMAIHRGNCVRIKYGVPPDDRPTAERSIGVWSWGSWLGVRKLTVAPLD